MNLPIYEIQRFPLQRQALFEIADFLKLQSAKNTRSNGDRLIREHCTEP